jgi:hypothetical protein
MNVLKTKQYRIFGNGVIAGFENLTLHTKRRVNMHMIYTAKLLFNKIFYGTARFTFKNVIKNLTV